MPKDETTLEVADWEAQRLTPAQRGFLLACRVIAMAACNAGPPEGVTGEQHEMVQDAIVAFARVAAEEMQGFDELRDNYEHRETLPCPLTN